MLARRSFPFFGVLITGAFARLANAAGAIAYPWVALDLGGPSFAGLVAASSLAPLILGHLFAGVAVDKLGVRACAVIGETVSAASALGIALLAATNQLNSGAFMALAALGAVLDGPARVANQARWPEIARLARAPLARATAIDSAIDHAATLCGPLAAGAALMWGGQTVALWTVAALACCGALGAITAMPGFRPQAGAQAALASIAAGFSCIANTAALARVTAIAAAAIAAFVSLESVVLPALTKSSPLGAAGLTAYLTAVGLGALAGATFSATLKKPPALHHALAGGMAGMAIGVAILALPLSWISLAVAGSVIGLSYGGLGPALATAFLTLPPIALRAQVNAVSNALMMTLAPIAAVTAGSGFALLGGPPMVLISAGVLGVLALVSLSPIPMSQRAS
jgi:MFS family permease